MRSHISRLIVLLGIEGGLGLLHTTATTAQMPPVLHRLPPPPPIPAAPGSSSSFNRLPVENIPPVESAPTVSHRSSVVREYVFQAPQEVSVPIPVGSSPVAHSSVTGPELYRVEVVGEGEPLLSRVRQVEPLAFTRSGEGVIQAGLFQQRSQAEQRLGELQAQGISARVATVRDNVRTVGGVSLSKRISR
jgi:hypothetical protein